MAARETQEQLSQRLAEAAKQVVVGARYEHFKGPVYRVLALAFREDDDALCVVYRAEYGDELTFTRPLASWLEEVEKDGKMVKRFTKLP